MDTQLAQMVSLTSYGNKYLKDHPILLDLNHSTTDICAKVEFIEFIEHENDKNEEIPIAKNPQEWFQFLKNEGVQRLNLHFASARGNRMDAPFVGGGGRWIIEVFKGVYSDVYDVRWNTGSSKDEERIWNVSYGLTSKDIQKPEIIYPPLSHWYNKLQKELTALRDIFKEQKKDEYTKIFDAGLLILQDSNPMSKIHHNDLIPLKAYSLEAQQVLAAVQKAYIVGMIQYIEGTFIKNKKIQAEKENISDNLFDTICKAVMVATNSPKLEDFN